MERLRVGIQMPEVERQVPWPEYAAMARTAEEVGFDSVWLGDHLLRREDGRPERGPWEVWTLLGAIAAVTERVELGPLVACTAFHPPGLIAKMAGTLAEVSGGRFVLGLGAGWDEPEFRAFGLPYDHRVSRFEEAFTIIRGLLAGERVTLDGRWFQADDAVLLPRRAEPPRLVVGSNGPRMLRATLPHVDVWNTWFDSYGNTPAGFAELNEQITAAATDAGRDPDDIERSACVLVALDGATGERLWGEDGIAPVSGSATEIAATLAELRRAGADEIIVVADPITEESIRALGPVVAQLRAEAP
jgi:alkanesulfonate monooxygenase SsuD/methylene tetrahydromethanopterin reductase-like flavin-dependent oxidoreductase (luciferase family)